jgi:hypothetical protein
MGWFLAEMRRQLIASEPKKFRTDVCPVCPVCHREIKDDELAHVQASNRRWDHEVDCLGFVKVRE